MAEPEHTHAQALESVYSRFRRHGNRYILVGLLLITFSLFVSYIFRSDPEPDMSKLGIHLLLDDGRGAWETDLWDEHIAYAGEMLGDAGYVVQLIRGDDLNPEKWQLFFDLCAEHKLTPIIRLATTYNHEENFWLAPEPDADGQYKSLAQQYVQFMQAIKWHVENPHFILLNEPNHGNEWGGKPDPIAYAKYLRDVATALREANGNVRILNAAFDVYAPHTGSEPFIDGFYYIDAETFMDEMVAYDEEIFRVINFWNSHSYPIGFNNPPWQQNYQFDAINDAPSNHKQPPENIYNRGINAYEWELWKLKEYGIDRPIMITETGWKHSEAIFEDSLDAGDGFLDAETVTQYLDMAMRGNPERYPDFPQEGWTPWLLDKRVIAVIPFALNGTPIEWSHTNWLQVSEEGEILGMYPMAELFISYQPTPTN